MGEKKKSHGELKSYVTWEQLPCDPMVHSEAAAPSAPTLVPSDIPTRRPLKEATTTNGMKYNQYSLRVGAQRICMRQVITRNMFAEELYLVVTPIAIQERLMHSDNDNTMRGYNQKLIEVCGHEVLRGRILKGGLNRINCHRDHHNLTGRDRQGTFTARDRHRARYRPNCHCHLLVANLIFTQPWYLIENHNHHMTWCFKPHNRYRYHMLFRIRDRLCSVPR